MQALSMIDMGAKAPETVAPAKAAEPQEKHFGQVLGEKQQPEQKPAVQNAETRQAEPAQQRTSKTVQAEKQPAANPQAEQTVPLAQSKAKAEQQVNLDRTPKLQQIVVDLMKVIAGGETSEINQALPETEKSELVEDLLAQLVQEVEGSELKGEQVLAGIDLSALVEQLQVLNETGGEEQVAQLVVQLEEQLVTEEGLLANAEIAAAMLPNGDAQVNTPKLADNLAQARQILQKAIDSVTEQKNPQLDTGKAVAAEETVSPDLALQQDKAKEVDPRFAGLLKPRTENQQPQQSLRQWMQQHNPAMNQAPFKAAAEVTGQQAPEMTTEQGKVADFVEQLVNNPKQAFENLTQQVQGQIQPNATAQAQGMTSKVMPNSPMVQLPSGQQVAESQIFDQVVARFSSSANGESSRMVLRLQPAELGSLKLELMVEGDRVRASLQAQTLQVQEVLERNLPQLRNALAEQGLKIDQFQVDVNQDQGQQDQFDKLAQQHQRKGGNARPQAQQSWETEEQIIPLAHLMQNGGGGISLHV